jgi:hypothetical protein
MGLRRSLDEPPPILQDQLSARDHVDPQSERRPLVSLSGAALRRLDPPERRRLLALALGPPREAPLPVPAPHADLCLFVTLAAPHDRLVECYDGSRSEAAPGLVGRDGASLAVLGRGPVVDHLDAWGGREAVEALTGLVARWEGLGRPGREQLRVEVSYGRDPEAIRRDDGTLTFDWV